MSINLFGTIVDLYSVVFGMTHIEAAERFWLSVNKSDGCWEWHASKSKGYGAFYFDGMMWKAHRFSYLLKHGFVAYGMDVCHQCDNRGCVNPDHLFIGSRLDNMRDAVTKGRIAKGETKKNTKLTELAVRAIRDLAKSFSQRELSRRFGVSLHTVQAILNGVTWKHVR